MPCSFNAVELCVVTINEKPWTRARKVCKALRYEKKTANTAKKHCSKESYAQKYQLSSVTAAGTPVDWLKDSQKLDIYINEEGSKGCYIQAKSQRQKISEDTVSMYCFLMFNSSLVISHMLWKLKALQVVSRPFSLRINPIDRSSKEKMRHLYCSMMT